jgi:hypothetical protein
MFVEGLLESVAEWYLHNLSEDMSKAKRERSQQGYHNNQAPFGMTKDKNKVLIPDEKELPGLRMAFGAYATGQYSDLEIAQMLNDAGYTLKNGNRFSKDTIREMLQSKVYIGKVQYRPFSRYEDGSENYKRYEGLEWFDGQHQAVISPELFERCQVIRSQRRNKNLSTHKNFPNLLKGLVYCYRCYHHPPEDAARFRDWGRMRVSSSKSGKKHHYFRCTSREYDVVCPQKSVQLHAIEDQVIYKLFHFNPPASWNKQACEALREAFEKERLRQRLDEIYRMIDRIGFGWNGVPGIDREDYLKKRHQLKSWVLQSSASGYPHQNYPHFAQYWTLAGDDLDKQQKVIQTLVKRVFIYDNRIVRIDLIGDYSLGEQ